LQAKLKDGLKIAMNVSALGNKFFQDTKPWILLKEDKPACEDVVATAAGLVRLLATLLEPYMPAFAHKVNLIILKPDFLEG
jgi:methionyl-tRNA synthetase